MVFFDWKEYVRLRPNLHKNWNGPVRSFIHFVIFRRVDCCANFLKKKRTEYLYKKNIDKSTVCFSSHREKSFFGWPHYHLFSKKVPAKIFSFQKDEALLEYWISHHASIFGMKNIFIIDHNSSAEVRKKYKKYIALGLHVYSFKGEFRDKHSSLSLIMSRNKRGADFLIPVDGDEFICINDGGEVSVQADVITNYLRSMRNINGKCKMTSYENLLESLNPKDVIAESQYFKKQKLPFYKQKTYYPAKHFVSTDQGNHRGRISEYNDNIISSKLVLLHYSRQGYEKYVKKIKNGIQAYGSPHNSSGRGWFNAYEMYKKDELKNNFIENYTVSNADKKKEDIVLFDNKPLLNSMVRTCPQMTREEQDLFLRYIKKAKEYFEFGSGGSTLYVFENSRAQITSVESSYGWISKLEALVPKNRRLIIKHVSIGEVGDWGRPIDKSTKHLWPQYPKAIHSLANKPDTIFIDGRFRVACIIQAILFCVDKKIKPKIILHDCVRKEYNIAYDILVPERGIKSKFSNQNGLQVFSLKREYDKKELHEMFDSYKYDYR